MPTADSTSRAQSFRAKVAADQLESQSLLVPEPVDLAADEAATVLEHRELLKKLGVAVEPFGGDTVLVSSYPAMLANLPPREVLGEVVDRLMSSDRLPEATDLLDELLHTVACKAAVKYGDRLTPEEITADLQTSAQVLGAAEVIAYPYGHYDDRSK